MSTTETNPYLVLSDLTLSAIQAEATRARLKHGDHSMLGPKSDDRRLAILTEEVGEVARELNDAEIDGREVDRDKLVKELIQVGAMAASWVEALEGEGARLRRQQARDEDGLLERAESAEAALDEFMTAHVRDSKQAAKRQEQAAATERERIIRLAEAGDLNVFVDVDGDGIAIGVPFAEIIRKTAIQERSDEKGPQP
jgi:NTP pyrophosphatase (non-canonical NTP hydrolase)